jgi:hypothetical protein
MVILLQQLLPVPLLLFLFLPGSLQQLSACFTAALHLFQTLCLAVASLPLLRRSCAWHAMPLQLLLLLLLLPLLDSRIGSSMHLQHLLLLLLLAQGGHALQLLLLLLYLRMGSSMPNGAGGGIQRPVALLLLPTSQPGTCRRIENDRMTADDSHVLSRCGTRQRCMHMQP